MFFILAQRRTLAHMHSGRLVIPFMACFIPLTICAAWLRVLRWAEHQSDSVHTIHAGIGWGAIVMLCAFFVIAAGGFLLGVVKYPDDEHDHNDAVPSLPPPDKSKLH